MPYRTALGHTYDSGEFERNMNDAVKLADVAGFEDRKRAARARGRLRGIGLSTYAEACACGPPESAQIEVARTGDIPVYAGTQANSKGHDTAYQQVVVHRLARAPDGSTSAEAYTVSVLTRRATGGTRAPAAAGGAPT